MVIGPERIALITGANTGIGRITAIELANEGFHVVLACRSLQRTQPVLEEIKATGGVATFVHLDLASFVSIRESASLILKRFDRIDLLINNAGEAGARGLTKDGFEMAFGVNHLGHFLFTTLLLDRIVASAPCRIINVSSRAHYRIKELDLSVVQQPTSSLTGLREYAASKLCNILFTLSLRNRLQGKGVVCTSLHPGVVSTGIWREVPQPFRWIIKTFMISSVKGAKTTLHCALSDDLTSTAELYYHNSKTKEPSQLAQDSTSAELLWAKSESWVA